MELVKKNVVNIVCGLIAVLAMIAWLWPISGMYDSFKHGKRRRA